MIRDVIKEIVRGELGSMSSSTDAKLGIVKSTRGDSADVLVGSQVHTVRLSYPAIAGQEVVVLPGDSGRFESAFPTRPAPDPVIFEQPPFFAGKGGQRVGIVEKNVANGPNYAARFQNFFNSDLFRLDTGWTLSGHTLGSWRGCFAPDGSRFSLLMFEKAPITSISIYDVRSWKIGKTLSKGAVISDPLKLYQLAGASIETEFSELQIQREDPDPSGTPSVQTVTFWETSADFSFITPRFIEFVQPLDTWIDKDFNLYWLVRYIVIETNMVIGQSFLGVGYFSKRRNHYRLYKVPKGGGTKVQLGEWSNASIRDQFLGRTPADGSGPPPIAYIRDYTLDIRFYSVKHIYDAVRTRLAIEVPSGASYLQRQVFERITGSDGSDVIVQDDFIYTDARKYAIGEPGNPPSYPITSSVLYISGAQPAAAQQSSSEVFEIWPEEDSPPGSSVMKAVRAFREDKDGNLTELLFTNTPVNLSFDFSVGTITYANLLISSTKLMTDGFEDSSDGNKRKPRVRKIDDSGIPNITAGAQVQVSPGQIVPEQIRTLYANFAGDLEREPQISNFG